MELNFKVFSGGGVFTSAEQALHEACEQAAAFAKNLPCGAIVNISHSHWHHHYALVTVWYCLERDTSDGMTNSGQAVSDDQIEDYLDS